MQGHPDVIDYLNTLLTGELGRHVTNISSTRGCTKIGA
ncbi:UNVERIFIED_ORG: bacterioferritin (cytochrome b1) [Pseudomonas vranovensis]|nr:bacterioferritin (cytochrome b1) [Pseudomonas vranovensis]